MVGTRPEAIKLAPVAAALRRQGNDPLLIFTGQHADLEATASALDAYQCLRLTCRGMPDPRAHAHAVARRLAPLLHDGPDLLIVQGDTSSALGGALAAEAAGVPLAHVEAGLRTHDLRLPWPEEEFRVAIDARADLLFAPTALSAANLAAERVAGAIHVTGNTGIDALLEATAHLPPPEPTGGPPTLLVTCHRRENWIEGLGSVAAAIGDLTADRAATADVLLHPNRHVSAKMRRLFRRIPWATLREPSSHRMMIAAMRSAALVLSDSGGVQEEAPALGVPLLVLRDKTERPEALASGNMILVGTDRKRIVAEVRRLLADSAALSAMSRPALPYGDGCSGPRIAEIVGAWLAERGRPRRRA